MFEPRIVVIGSSNTDLVIRSSRLPCPGQTVLGGDFGISAGGKGANQAVAAARAGAQVTFVANIGRDRFGDEALGRLRGEGIDTQFIVRSNETPSGVALILLDRHGENAISVAHSSNDKLSPDDVIKATAAIRRARCVVLQLEIPLATVLQAISIARAFGVPVLLNPAPARPLSNSLLRQVAILTPNELELAALSNQSIGGALDLEEASLKLVSAGVEHVLVTRGRRKVCWRSDCGVRWFAVPKVKAIDSVGAGDCFSGALAAAIARGESMAAAVKFAIAAAAISVTRRGAQSSMPTRREILRALRTRL